jgi:MraZ protein
VLTGIYPRTLDEKLRLAIPKKLLSALAIPDPEWVYITPGTDGTLAIYAETPFQALAQRLPVEAHGSEETRAYQRLFYAQAQRVQLDSQARIRIPAELSNWAKLESEVALIGVRDHLEIWRKAAWEEYLVTQQGRFDQLAASVYRNPASAEVSNRS